MVNPSFTSAHLGPDRVLQPRVAYEKGVSVSLPCGLQNLMWSKISLPYLLLSADTELSALFLFPTDPFMSTWLSAPGTIPATPYLLTTTGLVTTSWTILSSANPVACFHEKKVSMNLPSGLYNLMCSTAHRKLNKKICNPGNKKLATPATNLCFNGLLWSQ